MRSFSSCTNSGRTHPGGPSPPFPLGPVFFFSSILTVGSLRLFLVCFAAVSFPASELAPPPPILPFQAGLPPPGYRRSRPYCVASLLSLCLQPATTGCWRFCKWRAGVLGCAISEHSNRNVLLPKPLGRTTVPLQEQRPATSEQRVRTT